MHLGPTELPRWCPVDNLWGVYQVGVETSCTLSSCHGAQAMDGTDQGRFFGVEAGRMTPMHATKEQAALARDVLLLTGCVVGCLNAEQPHTCCPCTSPNAERSAHTLNDAPAAKAATGQPYGEARQLSSHDALRFEFLSGLPPCMGTNALRYLSTLPQNPRLADGAPAHVAAAPARLQQLPSRH